MDAELQSREYVAHFKHRKCLNLHLDLHQNRTIRDKELLPPTSFNSGAQIEN